MPTLLAARGRIQSESHAVAERPGRQLVAGAIGDVVKDVGLFCELLESAFLAVGEDLDAGVEEGSLFAAGLS